MWSDCVHTHRGAEVCRGANYVYLRAGMMVEALRYRVGKQVITVIE